MESITEFNSRSLQVIYIDVKIMDPVISEDAKWIAKLNSENLS